MRKIGCVMNQMVRGLIFITKFAFEFVHNSPSEFIYKFFIVVVEGVHGNTASVPSTNADDSVVNAQPLDYSASPK